MKLKAFLLNGKNIKKDSYIWNMVGSILAAFQSVFMLMVITRFTNLNDAGIFTIAFANANLFLTIGKYGTRYFQVSDMQDEFTFSEYRSTRRVTTAIMIMVSLFYVYISAYRNSYSLRKSLIIIWMCLFKTIDAIEDVYLGEYQRRNRLDIAAKMMTLRMIITILIFCVSIVLSKNLLLTLIVTTVTTTVLFVVFKTWTFHAFEIECTKRAPKKIRQLLKICFPLFAGAFLSFYIGNAPKYAIDVMLSDELQACYGFIAMPVFIIGLLNNFIFNPLLFHMSMLWKEGNVKEFVLKTIRQTGIIFLITVVCIIGAWLLGIPALSLLYNTNLAPYKTELLVLLLGGGFLGLSGLLNAVITIIRRHNSLMWGYVVVALLALIFSNQIVSQYEMLGAALLYAVLMGMLCIAFAGIFIYGVFNRKN